MHWVIGFFDFLSWFLVRILANLTFPLLRKSNHSADVLRHHFQYILLQQGYLRHRLSNNILYLLANSLDIGSGKVIVYKYHKLRNTPFIGVRVSIYSVLLFY